MMELNLLQMTYYQRSPLGKPLPALAMLRTELVWGAGDGRKDPKTGHVPPSCWAGSQGAGRRKAAGR